MMKVLSKVWFRILMGFVGGFILDEVRHILSGNPQSNTILILIVATFIFLLLSGIVWIYNWTQSKKLINDKVGDENILDDVNI